MATQDLPRWKLIGQRSYLLSMDVAQGVRVRGASANMPLGDLGLLEEWQFQPRRERVHEGQTPRRGDDPGSYRFEQGD